MAPVNEIEQRKKQGLGEWRIGLKEKVTQRQQMSSANRLVQKAHQRQFKERKT